MNRRSRGTAGEDMAAAYLRDRGCEILARNFRTRYAEIDIIALDREALIFAEVKYRKNSASGFPGEAVTPGKQHRIRTAALIFLQQGGFSPDQTEIRFDVIAILGNQIDWIRNAF